MSNLYNTDQPGFTIIELMIATMVFAIILVLVTFGMLQIGRTYYKGVTAAKTQNAARGIMDRISQAIQFSGGGIIATPNPEDSGTVYAFCINSQRYTFILDRQLTDGSPGADQSNHVLVVDTPPVCNPGDTSSPVMPQFGGPLDLTDNANLSDLTGASNPTELINANMRLAKLLVVPDPTDPNTEHPSLWDITVKVVYGDSDLLVSDPADPNYHQQCASSSAGTQFCAVSELTTAVKKRL